MTGQEGKANGSLTLCETALPTASRLAEQWRCYWTKFFFPYLWHWSRGIAAWIAHIGDKFRVFLSSQSGLGYVKPLASVLIIHMYLFTGPVTVLLLDVNFSASLLHAVYLGYIWTLFISPINFIIDQKTVQCTKSNSLKGENHTKEKNKPRYWTFICRNQTTDHPISKQPTLRPVLPLLCKVRVVFLAHILTQSCFYA